MAPADSFGGERWERGVTMQIEYAGASRIGQRKRNEDRFYLPNEDGPADLLMVADGMGGHLGGDVASAYGVAAVCESMAQSVQDEPEERLHKAVSYANEVIFDQAKANPQYDGMGTTMTVVLAHKDWWHFAHVGDSRAYIYQNHTIRQVTRDHSLVAEMEEAGSITHDQARIHPSRNIITRAVGTEPVIRVDMYREPILPGQVLLLCSDGLTDALNDEELSLVLGSGQELNQIAQVLMDIAEELGGKDNITVVLARVGEDCHG